MQLMRWSNSCAIDGQVELFVEKLERVILSRRPFMGAREYAQSLEEIELAHALQDKVSSVDDLRTQLCDEFSCFYDDPEVCLQRIHEVAGVGALYSCLSSLPIVNAFFKYGLCDSAGIIGSKTIVGRGHVAPAFYALRHRLQGFPLSFLMSVHDAVPAVVQRRWGFANGMRHSLGEGLPMAVGRALVGETPFHSYCFVGDGELNEGVSFEAIRVAYENDVKGLTVLVDNNHKGIERLPKPLNIDYLRAFFDNVIELDGRDTESIVEGLASSTKSGMRDVIVCHTQKKLHSYCRPTDKKKKFTCSSVAKIISDVRSLKQAHVFTADLAGRFGLSNQDDYINVGLSEVASVAMTMALPQDEIKFVLTDDKYLLNSIDTILSAMAHTQNLHIIAARKNAVWGGVICVPNIFSSMVEEDVYELIDPNHLQEIIMRSVHSGKNRLFLMNDRDECCLASLRQGYKIVDGSFLIKKCFPKDYVFVSTEALSPEVNKICENYSRTHIRILKKRPDPSLELINELMLHNNIVVVENNTVRGGLGEYLESILLRSVIKVAPFAYDNPSIENNLESIRRRLYRLEQKLGE